MCCDVVRVVGDFAVVVSDEQLLIIVVDGFESIVAGCWRIQKESEVEEC